MDGGERARRIGRRAGTALHALLIGGFTAVCGTQILLQVFAPDVGSKQADCRTGIEGLFRAVERARTRAAQVEGESAALRVFRRSLEPEWTGRAALGEACADDQGASKDLEVLDRLRYAEEAAVRDESSQLAPLRREANRRLASPGP